MDRAVRQAVRYLLSTGDLSAIPSGQRQQLADLLADAGTFSRTWETEIRFDLERQEHLQETIRVSVQSPGDHVQLATDPGHGWEGAPLQLVVWGGELQAWVWPGVNGMAREAENVVGLDDEPIVINLPPSGEE